MYSCTVFMPRMVWPTWLSMFPVEVTRMKAGSFSSSCSWGFHLRGRGVGGGSQVSDYLGFADPLAFLPQLPGLSPTDRLASDRSMLVPNLMM